jgi:hypothetical protein
MYPLKKVLDLWAQGSLTVKQAIGQIIQHLLALEKRVKALERRSGQDQVK